MSDFKRGDIVESLDDDFKGVVQSTNGKIITVQDCDGFRFEIEANKLIKSPLKNDLSKVAFESDSVQKILSEKSQPLKRKNTKLKSKKNKSIPIFEVDLHIHQLTDSTKGMSNYDMLNLQINTAQQQLEFAIKKRISKMVFIHGVGEGVLRMELHTLLRRYDNIEFFDADFQTYGYGATEVRIFGLNY